MTALFNIDASEIPPPLLGFRLSRADAAAAAALAAVVIMFFYPLIWQGRVPFFRDIGLETVPKKIFQQRSGTRVLWNPLLYFGEPLAANPQEAAFYPPALLFRMGDILSMLNLFLIVHFSLALLFTYLLVRARAAPPAAAAFAAIAFAGGGFFLSCGNQIVMLGSVTWLPALLWASDRALVSRSLRFAALAGLFWGLQVLAGEAEVAVLSGVIVAAYLGARLWEVGSVRTAALALGIALVTALAFSAVQWMLTLQYIPLSNRAVGFSPAMSREWSIEPARLLSLIAPDRVVDANGLITWVLGLRGHNPYLLSIYPGILCLLFALVGTARRRGNAVLLITVVAFVWLSLGPDAGLYRLLMAVPGFTRFRMPEKCLLGLALLAPLLAADGLPRLSELRRGTALTVAGPLLLAAAAFILALSPARPPADDLLATRHAMLGASMSHAWAASLAGLGAALLAAGTGRARLVAPLLVLAIGGDLLFANRFVIPSTGREFYSLDGNAAEGLSADLRGMRGVVVVSHRPEDEILSVGQDPAAFFRRQRLAMVPFSGLELGLSDALAATSLRPADQAKWSQLAYTGNLSVLLWSGINWKLSPNQPPQPLPNPLPRAFMVARAQPVANQEQALKAAAAPGFDPRREVLVETGEANPPQSAQRPPPPRIIREDNQTVEVAVKGPGWLVLLDSYYPGWRARVDGRSTPILRANVFFRTVWVEPGARTVIFSYWPACFYLGASISLASLLAAAIFIARPRGKVKAKTEDSTLPRPPRS